MWLTDVGLLQEEKVKHDRKGILTLLSDADVFHVPDLQSTDIFVS